MSEVYIWLHQRMDNLGQWQEWFAHHGVDPKVIRSGQNMVIKGDMATIDVIHLDDDGHAVYDREAKAFVFGELTFRVVKPMPNIEVIRP